MGEKDPRISHEYIHPAPQCHPGKEDAEHLCEVFILISWYVNFSITEEDARVNQEQICQSLGIIGDTGAFVWVDIVYKSTFSDIKNTVLIDS